MIVLCNVVDCLWYKKLEEPRGIPRHGSEANDFFKYTGECTREEIGVEMKEFTNVDWHLEIPQCKCFSQTHYRRQHLIEPKSFKLKPSDMDANGKMKDGLTSKYGRIY